MSSRLAIFAPAGTPAAIVARLNREIVGVVNLPEVKVKFHETQMEVVSDPPEALAALIKPEIATTAKIIKKAGIRADQADCAIIGENPQRTLLTTGGEEKQCSRATCRKH